MVPTMAALTASSVMALMLNALNHSRFLIFLLCRRYPNERLAHERVLWCGSHLTRWVREIDSWSLQTLKLYCHLLVQWLPYKLWASWTEPETTSYLVSYFVKEFYTVAVGLQTFVSDVKNLKMPTSRKHLIAPTICILFFFLQKNLCIWFNKGGDKGHLSHPLFIVVW